MRNLKKVVLLPAGKAELPPKATMWRFWMQVPCPLLSDMSHSSERTSGCTVLYLQKGYTPVKDTCLTAHEALTGEGTSHRW